MEKIYAGIDLHRKYCTITTMDEKGYRLSYHRVENKNTDQLINVLLQPNKLTKAAVESTYGWYWIADLCDKFPQIDLKLGHSLGIKAITSSKKKTDKIDSAILADLLRCNMFPESHKTSKSNREIKDILRARAYIVEQKASLKRRLHALLAKINLHLPYSDILGKKSIVWLKENIKQYPYTIELESALDLSNSLDNQIEKYDQIINSMSIDNENLNLITTVPGIGKIAGLTILSEIDDIYRFPHPRKLCSYAGLTPSVKNSGGKTYHGPVRDGNKYIRTMLAETFYHTIAKDDVLKEKYESLKATKGAGKAKVAVMRKIMTSIYYVLTKKQPYKIHTPMVSKLD